MHLLIKYIVFLQLFQALMVYIHYNIYVYNMIRILPEVMGDNTCLHKLVYLLTHLLIHTNVTSNYIVSI